MTDEPAPPPIKPGYTTSEFWLTLATMVLPIVTLIFHKDYSGYVQAVATAAAGVSTLAYTIMRSDHKTRVAEAVQRGKTPSPVVQLNNTVAGLPETGEHFAKPVEAH